MDAATLAELETLVPLAPLHQPHNLAAMKAVAQTAAQLPQIACFDTAFHRNQPSVAQAFGLPRRFPGKTIPKQPSLSRCSQSRLAARG